MFFHSCGTTIKARMTSSYFADITLTTKSIRIAAITGETDAVQEKFLHCEVCHTDITPDKMKDIHTFCQVCGKELLLSEAFTPIKTGGIYCVEHVKENFSDETHKSIQSIVSSKF